MSALWIVCSVAAFYGVMRIVRAYHTCRCNEEIADFHARMDDRQPPTGPQS